MIAANAHQPKELYTLLYVNTLLAVTIVESLLILATESLIMGFYLLRLRNLSLAFTTLKSQAQTRR